MKIKPNHRNVLWNAGPNYAADTVVTRYEPENRIVEVLLIQRKDSGKWALPGGFVNPGESEDQAAARELLEETGIDLSALSGNIIYKGVVDDPRNSADSWIETMVLHKHLSVEQAHYQTHTFLKFESAIHSRADQKKERSWKCRTKF